MVTVLKARGKRVLAGINCICKMTSAVALDGVTSFLRLKYATYSCKRMRHSLTIGAIYLVQWQKLEEAGDFKCVFVVYCVLDSK